MLCTSLLWVISMNINEHTYQIFVKDVNLIFLHIYLYTYKQWIFSDIFEYLNKNDNSLFSTTWNISSSDCYYVDNIYLLVYWIRRSRMINCYVIIYVFMLDRTNLNIHHLRITKTPSWTDMCHHLLSFS